MWRELLHGLRQLAYPNLCLWCRELHDDPAADFWKSAKGQDQ